MMNAPRTRTYTMSEDLTLAELSAMLEQYLSVRKNLRTQMFHLPDRVLLQCAGDDAQWMKYLGMDAAVTVELKAAGNILTATVGDAKWLDKIGTAAVGAVLFPPLLLTAGIGALRQSVLPDEIFDYIEGKLLRRETSNGSFSVPVCPDCGRKLHVGDIYCGGCGRKL